MGKFYGIGVGPGDEELITVKAARILSDIDVLLVPEAKAGAGSVALDIAKKYVNPEAEIVSMEFPMVTDKSIIKEAASKASRFIEKIVGQDGNIAFITLGDPSTYSTFAYIAAELSPEVKAEVVPGVPSFCAAAAQAGKSLAEGDEVLSIIPATLPEERIREVMQVSGSVVLMKASAKGGRIPDILSENGLEKTGVLVKRCGLPGCRVFENIREGLESGREYLSLILSRKEDSND